MNDNDKKNNDDWENVFRSFMGEDVFDASGLSRFFHPDAGDIFSLYAIETRDETGKVIKTVPVSEEEYKKWKRKEKERKRAEKRRKVDEDWKNRPFVEKFVFFLIGLALFVLAIFGIIGIFIDGF